MRVAPKPARTPEAVPVAEPEPEAPQPPALATTGVSNAWPVTLGLLTLLAAAILVVRHKRELEDGE